MTQDDRRREAREAGPSAGATARIGIDNPGAFGEAQPLTAEVVLADLSAAVAGFPPEATWMLTYASPLRLEFETR